MPPLTEETIKNINRDYQHGKSTFQLAHMYYCDINQVYHALGMSDMLTVRFQGDLLDEAIPGVQTKPYEEYNVKYDKN
jgi:hypothetical protein